MVAGDGSKVVLKGINPTLKTSNNALQLYLDSLVVLIGDGNQDKKTFVDAFVPLDIGPEDIAAFVADLSEPESDQWTNLISEVQVIASGENTQKIETAKDEKKVIFFFEHPILGGCDREVAFIFEEGEWRAEG